MLTGGELPSFAVEEAAGRGERADEQLPAPVEMSTMTWTGLGTAGLRCELRVTLVLAFGKPAML
eukprot:366481-Chlamydomonas_euryale.AAC.2